jgi:RNA polymerase sigma factor (sigma-70 family)
MTRPPDATSDVDRLASLLLAARHGQHGAFEELVVACRPFVTQRARQNAWRLDDVDDIVQEVWIRLFEHAGAIREPRALLGWLAMVTARTAAAVGRRRGRVVQGDHERPVPQQTEELVIGALERREVGEGVRAALARLDSADRRMLLLLEGSDPLPYRDVSRAVQRPIGSLGPTRQRLLRRLRHDPAVRRLRVAG